MLEQEVQRITIEPGKPFIIEWPDGKEEKYYIRAIPATAFFKSAEIVPMLIKAFVDLGINLKDLGAGSENPDIADALRKQFRAMSVGLKDSLGDFIHWIIEAGTTATWEDIQDVDFLIVLELALEVIERNMGERLMAFFTHAMRTVSLMTGNLGTTGLAVGPLPKASSLTEDTIMQPSETGA